jgi:D(-)-tartrate dehydratase
MRITSARTSTIRVASPIRNAHVSFAEMTGVLVALRSDVRGDGKPLVGYGFGSIGRYSAAAIVHDRILPRLLDAPPDSLVGADGIIDPLLAWPVMMRNEKQGGHGERSVAVGAVDMALWDLVAKVAGVPLRDVIAKRFNAGRCDGTIEVYAAGGYYHEGDGLDALRREISGYLERGYTAVKIKIGGAPLSRDLERIRVAADLAGGAGNVAVDANGRFDFATALAYAQELRAVGVRWFEEPGDPLDFDLQSRLAAQCPMPYATGENVFSHQDTRNLVRHAGLDPHRDRLQMDPALSYGLPEYLRMLDVIRAAGWSPRRCIPHGGHQFSLHLAAGLQLGGNEAYPDVFQPLGGFADSAVVRNGRLELPVTPGIGIEAKSNLIAAFRELAP